MLMSLHPMEMVILKAICCVLPDSSDNQNHTHSFIKTLIENATK